VTSKKKTEIIHDFILNGQHDRTLIKSTLAAMPVYVTIRVALPGWLIKALEKIMKEFLWSGTEEVQGDKCTVAWGKVQRPL
jgi:hypothetical protein